jgi:hypothetical protein
MFTNYKGLIFTSAIPSKVLWAIAAQPPDAHQRWSGRWFQSAVALSTARTLALKWSTPVSEARILVGLPILVLSLVELSKPNH